MTELEERVLKAGLYLMHCHPSWDDSYRGVIDKGRISCDKVETQMPGNSKRKEAKRPPPGILLYKNPEG
jgi:hypothetical protein